ncbi:hypothetical protein V7S57_16790 [Caulobacter sp. CCNWLY153]|uniref:hypothetical protein n=1 Tax=unclassified Caulobacter TaxID=2648921 RepID=UPI002FEF236E
MGTRYAIGISSGDIGGAVALALIEDVRGNGLGLQGFPQIVVGQVAKDFHITMKFDEAATQFVITADEAQRAVKAMKAGSGYSQEILERVLDAAANLEGATQR